jgi:P27 family predicted phage terminase small subunit
MTQGRKRTPTALKLVKGNPGKRALPANEAQPDLSRPKPPGFLGRDGRFEWARVIEVLFTNGLMTDLDVPALTAYCDAFGQWAQAVRALERDAKVDASKKYGFVEKTSSGNNVQNPLVGIRNKARSDCVRFALEFGMSPSSRSKVNAVFPNKPANAAPAKKKNPADEFFAA